MENKKMKQAIVLLLLCVSVFSGYASVRGEQLYQDSKVSVTRLPKVQDSGIKLLQFSMVAKKAKYDPQSSKIILKDVDPKVLFFSNAPRRIQGTMDLTFFLKRWVKSAPHDYKTNPPNALLSYSSTESQDRKNIIIQLLSPKYISDTHELSFIVKSLDDSTPVLSRVMNQPQLMYASPAMCGLLGAWGNLPGEKKYDQACHHAHKDKSIYKK